MKFSLTIMPVTLILSLLATTPALGSDTTKKKHKNKNQANTEMKLELSPDSKAVLQAQEELDQTEQFLTEKDPTTTKRKPATLVKSETSSPQFLEKLGNADAEGDVADREEHAKSLGAAMPAKQALSDFQNAQETLKEVKVEWKAKKAHVKTKSELKEDREEMAYRAAITKASKESARKKGKLQFVQTPKGKVKVVFIDEKEFADSKTDTTSSQLTDAVKGVRGPASVDDQIDSVTQ